MKADNETLLPVSWDLAIMDNHRSKIMDQFMVASVSTAALIISTTMPDGLTALHGFIFQTAFFTMSIVIGICGPSNSGSLDR